ncbi:alpha-glucosidase [Loktanella sp. IMCC34160]|nr:alpha-glucosidase [Loktanella sp. IMCC34160]RYG91766.1 alpha-glucosidase [Loktanella sp. IMCC34160]
MTRPSARDGAVTTPWWKKATGYQIYPRSFCDSNGDGIGDIPGIISKLDHLQDLGIGFIWLSPVYRSPMVDNGYDISDYQDVAPEYGTMQDLDRLIDEAANRGIGLVMDLVVNHCSDQHAWFRKAVASSVCREHDYFIWADATDGPDVLPSDIESVFGGPAWTHLPEVGKFYFHQFASGQPDLNWQNPELRAEIYAMMNWWLDRGIAGFRMDVIDLIGKDVGAGKLAEGPYLHDFLQEMHSQTVKGRDVLTVGESWCASPETGPLYCGEDRDELSMIFQFDHIKATWDPEFGKWKNVPVDLPRFKTTLANWQYALEDSGWNSLFLSNHDLPRQVSRYGDDGTYRNRSAKMLAIMMHLLKGTPFVYQGEEIGMTNANFHSLEQYRDLEVAGRLAEALEKGSTVEVFLEGARRNARDNARTPMQWTAGENAGFGAGAPWIDVNMNHTTINVAADGADPDGIIHTYKQLIEMRKTSAVVREGRTTFHVVDHKQVCAYTRELGDQTIAVVANMSADSVEFVAPPALCGQGQPLVSNIASRHSIDSVTVLEPYEAYAVLRNAQHSKRCCHQNGVVAQHALEA